MHLHKIKSHRFCDGSIYRLRCLLYYLIIVVFNCILYPLFHLVFILSFKLRQAFSARECIHFSFCKSMSSAIFYPVNALILWAFSIPGIHLLRYPLLPFMNRFLRWLRVHSVFFIISSFLCRKSVIRLFLKYI